MSGLVKKIRNYTIIGAIGLASLATAYSYFIPDKVTTIINGTEVKRFGDKDKYLIFTDEEVYENTDSLVYFKFKSANLQNKAMKLNGKKVEITKSGWRFGPFSWYENILDVKEVK